MFMLSYDVIVHPFWQRKCIGAQKVWCLRAKTSVNLCGRCSADHVASLAILAVTGYTNRRINLTFLYGRRERLVPAPAVA